MVASPLDLGADRAKIIITSLAHNDSVSFVPYNFTFDDNIKPEWNEYSAFGRMDPVMAYKKTSRDINISFDVVADSNRIALLDSLNEQLNKALNSGKIYDAIFLNEIIQRRQRENQFDEDDTVNNFIKLQKLIKFLYPVYSQPLNAVGDIGRMQEKLNQKRNQLNDATQVFTLNDGQPREDDAIQADLLNQLSQEVVQAENAITQAQAAAEENRTIQDFGINIIQKSPLFIIKFLNLINNSQYVCAVTNFKHKLFFDEGSTNNSITADGQFIPGKFNISLGFKVMHNYLPGTKLNY